MSAHVKPEAVSAWRTRPSCRCCQKPLAVANTAELVMLGTEDQARARVPAKAKLRQCKRVEPGRSIWLREPGQPLHERPQGYRTVPEGTLGWELRWVPPAAECTYGRGGEGLFCSGTCEAAYGRAVARGQRDGTLQVVSMARRTTGGAGG